MRIEPRTGKSQTKVVEPGSPRQDDGRQFGDAVMGGGIMQLHGGDGGGLTPIDVDLEFAVRRARVANANLSGVCADLVIEGERRHGGRNRTGMIKLDAPIDPAGVHDIDCQRSTLARGPRTRDQ